MVREINRKRLVEDNIDLVRAIVDGMTRLRSLSRYDREDLVSEGFVGLVDAANRYQEQPGKEFHYYAGIRIKGAILDYLRRKDLLSRGERRMMRQRLDEEGKLEIPYNLRTPPKYRLLSLEGPASRGENYMTLSEILSDDDTGPEVDVLIEDSYVKGHNLLEKVKGSGWLKPKEVLYITLIQEQFLGQDIAKILGLSVGRISQIRKQVIQKVRGYKRRTDLSRKCQQYS